ncbi:mitogen-activated protein kinase kinase kinase 4 [Diaphorina citri]|uniref:Mitogen-activated protein kinase kinase kinase 4 n=2 Tax=Diaphorina citri TaxID=121845 RepID=A0A3Q0J2Z4_DIACI|nr:mitogen-activated protein kinase kinase kinase 4 [Diaphorina citri]
MCVIEIAYFTDVVSIRADIKHNFVKSCLIPTCKWNTQSIKHANMADIHKVETCKRFMCLTSKLVAHKSDRSKDRKKDARGQFHRLLIKMGNTDKQIGTPETPETDQLSQEQEFWQSEFKDLIWLELQAWYADRTLTQQDKFLCDARQGVKATLYEFMNFRFNPPPGFHHKQGIFSEEFQDIDHPPHQDDLDIISSCEKCLYIFCGKCIELQNLALKEVAQLFEKMDMAESLYPSSKAFAAHYPLYASEPFVARLKTLNLWFNTSKQVRCRLLIIARTFEEEEKDLNKQDRRDRPVGAPSSPAMEEDEGHYDMYENLTSSSNQGNGINFIKKNLKKRGLVQSLTFLEKLHRWLVRQQKTFQLPEENSNAESTEFLQDDLDLARHGYWSKDFRKLNLPSSRGVFLFLARIPLDIMHSYFRLRLETNPEKPSPMSLLQLMTELKKGIRLAVLNKQRYLRHVSVALRAEEDSVKETFNRPIHSFDESMQRVLELYLKYLQEWVNIVQQEVIKKYILEEEWVFVKSISPHIPGGRALCGASFCQMASSMLRGLCNRFKLYKDRCSTEHLDRANFDEKVSPGQGRFGKVYTAVNNETGELVAMKEIQLHKQNDARFVKDMLVELRILEGINQKNLVKYYGVEIHREEMVLFMELCTEGTLESLVQSTEDGLPEVLVRRYTKQLVDAISALHENTIVHRDIKSANIFLTAEGNSLKLGDFGSAVKISAHTTVPGELNGFVGTQAYMAPEVFMDTNKVGHGRAVDIWSLGCVLVEMSSGKRPWAEYDSNYQIMFKVGMGETPTIPESLSDEGQAFAELCLRHDPAQRATIFELLQHPFLIVSCEEDVCNPRSVPASVLQDYLKLGIVLPPMSEDSVKVYARR